jgi:hypothetical protein
LKTNLALRHQCRFSAKCRISTITSMRSQIDNCRAANQRPRITSTSGRCSTRSSGHRPVHG